MEQQSKLLNECCLKIWNLDEKLKKQHNDYQIIIARISRLEEEFDSFKSQYDVRQMLCTDEDGNVNSKKVPHL